jgi:hypothetical protein
MINVAVLLPTRGRAEQMTERVSALLGQKTPRGVSLTVYLSVEKGDKETVKAAGALAKKHKKAVQIVKRDNGTSAVQGWNLAYAAAMSDGPEGPDWLVLGADDVEWGEGWLDEALKVAKETGAEFIGLYDGHHDLSDLAPHYMVSAGFTSIHLGGVMIPPAYTSWSFDRELTERAQGMGVYAPAHNARVIHSHPAWGTAEMDDTYKAGHAAHENDRAVFRDRKAWGWPVNYESVL